MVRTEIDEKAAYIQARSSMARVMEVNGKERQAEGKAKMGLMKSSIWKTHENCEGIYFIDPEDKEFKETIKNTRKKLETSVAPVMLCKIMKKNCGNRSDKNTTKLACILEANESTRMRMGNSLPNHHEDHIAGKDSITICFTNLFLCLKL